MLYNRYYVKVGVTHPADTGSVFTGNRAFDVRI